jgi:hypothetical protein
MRKKAAVRFFPLNSTSLISIKTLAHNLVHKICEEHRSELLGQQACSHHRRRILPAWHQGSDYTSLALPGHAQILSVQTYVL